MASLFKTIYLDYTYIASLLKLKPYKTPEQNQNECKEGNNTRTQAWNLWLVTSKEHNDFFLNLKDSHIIFKI